MSSEWKCELQYEVTAEELNKLVEVLKEAHHKLRKIASGIQLP